MKEPIRVFSDLHLGHPASRITDVEQLRPLLQGAATAIFNGDTWQELAPTMRVRGAQLLADLHALCAELGVEPYFLPGNHDPSISEQSMISLDEGRIIIFHGHIIYPEVSPWSRYYLAHENEVQAYLAAHLRPDLTIDERTVLAHEVVALMTPRPGSHLLRRPKRLTYFLNTLWPPRRLATLIRTHLRAKHDTYAFCQAHFPTARHIITGHFHRCLHLQRQEVTIHNTGAFMAGCQSCYLEINKGNIINKNIIKKSK